MTITPSYSVLDDSNTSPKTCYEPSPHLHCYSLIKSNETDLVQVIVHFINTITKEQINAQTESLKAAYEYLKVMRLGKHERKD